MRKPKTIRGAGGGKDGGGASRAPNEAPDSLRSRAYARVLDLVCEGEIDGLVDGAKSIYLDDTQLQNDDGTWNFQGAVWAQRQGTQGQAYIPGFGAVENSIDIGTRILASQPVTRTFSNPNLTAVVVIIWVPQLTKQDTTTGDLGGSSVTLAIDLQSAGAGFVAQDLGGRETITGKTTSRYQRAYRIPLTGSPPWDIRVTRVTADSESSALVDRTFWDAATELIDAKLRYPNSALMAIEVDAAQFSAVPRRAYDMRLLRVLVPTNYAPATRTYTGAWDGTFKVAWTDNPAWCFYDLLTVERYGLGDFVDASQVDKWALYTIAQYCDELVPDGFGGQEPRFTCNIYMQTRAEAFKVVADFASIFRGMAFWTSGAITAVQDAPTDASYVYAPANVVGGQFSYSGSGRRARHTVALVTWNDPADFYRQKVEYVEDRDGIERYGVITTDVISVGCTSRGQAHRAGKWILYSERLESETVTFRVGLDGAIARPGQVIKIADPARAGARMGGRLLAATTSAVTLDAAIALTAGASYTFCAIKADGTLMETPVSHSGGSLTAITLSPALPEAPAVGGMWVVSGGAVEAQTFRVVAISETDKHEFEIVALAHDPEKFDAVEADLILEPRSISLLGARPDAPTGLVTSESLYATAQGVRTRLSVSWAAPAGATGYAVTLQPADGNVGPELTSTVPSIDIPDVFDGIDYTVRVVAFNAIGRRSAVATAQHLVIGKTARPADVAGFTVARQGDVLNFVWRHVADVDLSHYEIRQGEVWGTALAAGATVANTYSIASQRGGSYLIKAVDMSGNESENEALVAAADVSSINVVEEYDDADAGFTGTHDHTFVFTNPSPAAVGVTLVGDAVWDDLTEPWTSYTRPWAYMDQVLEGTYTLDPIDIGYVAPCVVSLSATVELLSDEPPWEFFNQPWNYYAGPEWTWQGRPGGLSAQYELRTSDDGSTWSAWSPFIAGAYEFRHLQVRVALATDDPNRLPYLTEMVVRIDVPDRVLHFPDVSVSTSGETLSFSPTFIGLQTVQVTLQSAASGDRFTVTSKSTSGVTINVYDSGGSPKAGLVDVDVFGYGERT